MTAACQHESQSVTLPFSRPGLLPPAPLPADNHFGFQLEGDDQVRAARERLRAAGVEETEWQDDDIVVRVQVADPDGYRVELYAFGPRVP